MKSFWEGSSSCQKGRPYPMKYVEDVYDYKVSLFRLAPRQWPNCNIDHFIVKFMQSKLQSMIDWGHPHWMEMLASELLTAFIEEGYQPVYTRSVLWGDSVVWAAQVYTVYQWRFMVHSADLIKWFPPVAVARLFNPWHTQELYRLMEEFPIDKVKETKWNIPNWLDPETYWEDNTVRT